MAINVVIIISGIFYAIYFHLETVFFNIVTPFKKLIWDFFLFNTIKISIDTRFFLEYVFGVVYKFFYNYLFSIFKEFGVIKEDITKGEEEVYSNNSRILNLELTYQHPMMIRE